MLKQTIEDKTISGEQILLPKGDLVDLGNFKEFIHNHDESRTFSMTFKVAPPIDLYDAIPTEEHIADNYEGSSRLDNLNQSIENLSLGITVSFSFEQAKGLHVSKVDLHVGNDPAPIITFVNEPPEIIEGPADDEDGEVKRLRERQWRVYKSSPKGYLKFKKTENHDYWATYFNHIKEDEYWSKWKEPIERLIRSLNLPMEEKTLEDRIGSPLVASNLASLFFNYDFLRLSKFLPVELNGYHPQYLTSGRFENPEQDHISVLILAVSSIIKDFLSNCVHLGPIRHHPERNFFFGGIISSYVGITGEYANEILVGDPELVEKVNIQLSRLHLGYQVRITPLESASANVKVSTIRLVTDAGIDLAITDVGYGISQILPIIVQSVMAKGKSILIEQPELHLHPAQQAELGDMFIQSALDAGKNTFLIETHSEHLLLRVMRRMRETKNRMLPEGVPPVTPNDVCLLFVEPYGSQSIVREMPLNDNGELMKAWPGGFFEEGLREVF
jgi:hypothetical protein